MLILVTEVTLELFDLVVMQLKHTMSHIFNKNFGNWKTSCQNFNKKEAIDWRKMKKRRNQLILSLLSKKLILKW